MELKPLTRDEMLLIPELVKILKTTTYQNPLYAQDLLNNLNIRRKEIGIKSNLTSARMRKMINHIRSFEILPVISGGRGYYVSRDTEDIAQMIVSLKSRVAAIEQAIIGLGGMAQTINYEKTINKLS